MLRGEAARGRLSSADADAIVSFLFALGDGFALQALSDPERDLDASLRRRPSFERRYLLVAE